MLRLGYSIMWAGAALPRTTAGIAAAAARHWPQAEEHHQAAIHQAAAQGLRVCQPIARYWYADMLSHRNEADDSARARAQFTEALAIFESLEMPLYARQASEKLAAVST